MRSLVIDDSATVRKLLYQMLTAVGTCVEAADGNIGVETWRQALEDKDPFQLVCLDLIMPEKDGQAVLREIRETEAGLGIALEDRTKVIIITSQASSTNLLKAIHWKADAFLAKPFTRETLFFKLQELELL